MSENKTLMPAKPALDETLNEDVPVWSPYDSAPVSGDQRRSYRYPAQPGREVATVRSGSHSWKAHLREESAGGMAVETVGKGNFMVNDEVEVGIYTGWYRARIVHAQAVETGHRLGLQRISIISTGDDHPRRKKDASTPSQIRNLVAVAFVAMALGVGATNYVGGWFESDKNSLHSGIPTHFAEPNEGLKGVLDGVNLLLEPQVAEGLKLSKNQQQSIEGVLIGASNSLGEAYRDSQDKPPQVWYTESQNIVNTALENILCSLTDEQIVKWRALMMHRRKLQQAD